jgi:hypothetical protein
LSSAFVSRAAWIACGSLTEPLTAQPPLCHGADADLSVTAAPRPFWNDRSMARTWLSIRVDLVSGNAEDFWPRPGRILAAARSHTFADLATAIDDAFARWDRAHLRQFWLGDGARVTDPSPDWDDDFPLDEARLKLSRLQLGEQFVYEFDFGDSWLHLCSVAEQRIDPLETLGVVPTGPLPYWGWGQIPDQYGRRWDGDDGESRPPRDPKGTDLPRIGPWQYHR